MWYREGTITFTQGSNTLVGAGTAWNVTANGVLPGMIVIGPDNKLYEIKRVTSDTNIVLSEPYTGETQSEVPCRIITTYEGDLTQFSARFTALMSRMSADSKSMRSWLTALDEVTIEREDGTEVTVKPLMQIVNEHNENVEWYKNNTDAIDAAGDKAREAAASAAAAAESANTAGEKASQASQSASAAASSQSAASASATAAKKSETNAQAAKEAAAESASVASAKASEAATSASSASASKDAAKASETNASSSANAAASSATEAANSSKAAKTSEANAKASETAAEQSASSANSSKSAAEASASAASASADSASSSATAAGKSADSALSSATTATTKATEATSQATAAKNSASAAKTSETNAKTSEDNAASSKAAAAESASSASASASSASASKDEATKQASEAKGSASTASTKATEAAGSATAASQSKTAAESAATRAEAAADRAEEIAGAVAMEDASLTTKGVVKLSSAVDSTSESLAATPKAVKAANDNANSRVPSNRKINGKALTADITLTPKDIGTLNSVTMSFSGGAGWFKLATVTMPQASSIVYITLIGGAGYNVNSPMQAGISELVLRAGNGNPKGLTGALWRRTSVGFTNFAWVNTSGDTYDIYVEIGNYATSVNVHWDCTANASVSIYTSPTYSASKPASVTDGVVYTMYSSHQKPTPSDIGALPTTGGTVSGPLSVTGGLTGSLNGNASTATKLQTTRTIGGVGFDGSANINLPGVNTTGNQNTTGNAATATKLQTARTIGGVSFDGTANINLPGVNTTGNQNTTGNAATATKLQTARTINGVSFDGSKNIELTPRSIGTINSATMSFSGGAGWFKLATVTMPQASSVVYISLIGGAGYNVGSPHQAGISELVLRAGNGNPKGITGALWRRTSVGFTNFAWVNTSGDTYDVYVEIGNYATSVNIQWDYTKDAIVQIHTSPTYTANKPTGLTDGTVYVIYSSHIKPTATDVGALPTTGGTLTGGLTAAGEIISKSANGLRIAYGSYGFFIRNDGSNTYFMLTNSGNSLGTYNSLRPLIINNANGAVTIANGLNVTGGVNGSLNGNASTATKLQTARKISGVSFDGSSDITLKASHVGAFALGQTGSRVANDKAVGWNWNSGVYDADISGATTLILHFNMNVGSCPAVQFRVNYMNGGIFYRSARDGYGFEEDWTQIYTKKDSIPGVNTTGNQNTTGNAATATKLQTARKIAGVAFDGSADITLTAANLNAYTKTEVTNLLSSYVKSSALPSMTVRTSSVSGGDMGMSLSTFISHLKSNGAFSKSYWIGFGDAMGFNAGSINNITGFGAVELAESIIEVFNLPNGDYTIRLTTSHKADYGGVTNAILVYHYRSNRSPSGQWLKFAGTVGATSN